MTNACENCGAKVNSIFVSLESAELGDISEAKSCHPLKRSETLVEEGAMPRGLFCVHDGHLKVVRSGADGREQIIRFAGPGDTIGYTAMITQQPYSISVVAVEPSSVCLIPTPRISNYLQKNPRFALSILEKMSIELQQTEQRVVELAQKSVRERVAEALLVLKNTFGTEEDGETLILPLTREEIADIVGTAPESLIRMLSDLKADHIIETNGRRIRLVNHKALVQTANLPPAL